MIARVKIYKPRTMLDSGAFSAWYHKDTVDLKAYMAFIAEHGQRFFSIVALDKIPGEKALMAKTQADIEAAARESHKNFEIMRKAGIDAIPVFHQGEDFKWLERMLNDKVPYIGISPYMKAKTESIRRWMDECFTRLTDERGWPLCKTHGFGVTGHEVVRRYPWFSVDSTSWALSAGYGNVLMPRMLPSGADFTHPVQFNISDRDTAGNNSMLHMGPAHRKLVDAYFDALGVTFSEVRNFQAARLVINASYFMGLEKQLASKPFAHRLKGWKARSYSQRAAEFNFAPSIFLATMIKIQQQGEVLTKIGAPNRLLSYYDCRNYEPEVIEQYTSIGYRVKDPFLYARGTKRGDLRRRMLFLKRLDRHKGDEENATD
jgi:hypothetical protein